MDALEKLHCVKFVSKNGNIIKYTHSTYANVTIRKNLELVTLNGYVTKKFLLALAEIIRETEEKRNENVCHHH